MTSNETIQDIRDEWMAAVHRATKGQITGHDPSHTARRGITTLAPILELAGWGVFPTSSAEAEPEDWPFFLVTMGSQSVVRLAGRAGTDGHSLVGTNLPFSTVEHMRVMERPDAENQNLIRREWRFTFSHDVLTLVTSIPHPGIGGVTGTIREERLARALARACGWKVADYDSY